MKLARISLLAVAVVGLSARAQAGPVFDFATTVSAAVAPEAPINPPGSSTALVSIAPAGDLNFTTNSGSNIDASLAGGADINFGEIQFLPSGGGSISPFDVNFNYLLALTANGETAYLNLLGHVSGSATSSGSPLSSGINASVQIFSFASDPIIKLGDTMFKLAIRTTTGPGSSGEVGVLQVNVQAMPAAVPEPASVVMLGLGAIAGIGVLRRFRRTAR